ncbi:MAG: hypothetical protein H8E61_07325 [Bacteroidetes bacterium]|nr:hypothetical protein [Bacteroidota bacterium]
MLLEILNETFKLKDFDSGRIDSIQIVADREEWNLEEQLKKLNIQYLNICGSDLPIESSSLGLICSNNTLEHINSTILEKIFIEFKRIKSPLGIMSHFIDMSDHFAHLDNQISAFNFLKFSPGAWKMIDNSLQPQNRLRIADYRALHRNANFEILDEIDTNGKNEDVDQQEIADCFKKIKKEDLFVTHSHIVSI